MSCLLATAGLKDGNCVDRFAAAKIGGRSFAALRMTRGRDLLHVIILSASEGPLSASGNPRELNRSSQG
jgi:hypothetical protein